MMLVLGNTVDHVKHSYLVRSSFCIALVVHTFCRVMLVI